MNKGLIKKDNLLVEKIILHTNISILMKLQRIYKKLNDKEQQATNKIIDRLANDKSLETKYRDHALKGEYIGFRECHIKPDLLLIYRKDENILELYLASLGNHNNIF